MKVFQDHLREIIRWRHIIQEGKFRRGNGRLITDPFKLACLAQPASARFYKTWKVSLTVGDIYALQDDFNKHSLILWQKYKQIKGGVT
jgi:hypothetical protein